MRSAVLLALGTVLSFAQSAPEFEAASVKSYRSQPAAVLGPIPIMRGGPGTSAPGRIHYSNVNLLQVIMKAYDLTADQVQGPGWMREERFTIEAVVPEGTSDAQFRQMLQNLLVSRFRLGVRWEEREFRIFRLTVAPGGAKLKPSAVREDNEEISPVAAQGGPPKADVDTSGCPVLAPDRRASVGRDGCTTFVGWSMEEFARLTLAMSIGQETGKSGWAIVHEETGLRGRYDFTLRYDIGYHMMRNSPLIASSGREVTSRNPTSIFKAVEPQLGLLIEPATARLKVMVIEQASRMPAEN